MQTLDEQRRERAAQRRRSMAFTTSTLETDSERTAPPSTAAERLSWMWGLACDSWALSGREMPSYPRSEMPGRVLRNTGGQ